MATRKLTELRGFQATVDGLKRAGIAINGTAASAIMLKGAAVIADAARSLAPLGIDTKHPGSLKRAVITVTLSPQAGKPAAALVMVNYKPARGPIAPHAHLVEQGTRAHVIRAKNGKDLELFGGKVFRASVQHPGAQGRHFFGDAVSSSRLRARVVIREGLAALIEKEAKP